MFGWHGGSKLVKDSYGEAKVKKDEMSEDRQEKKAAKREARVAEGRTGIHRFRKSAEDEKDDADQT